MKPDKLFANDNPVLTQRAKILRREMSDAEQRLWFHLRAGRLNGYKFRRQQAIGRYIVDFVCVSPKLIIEADGSQHIAQAEYDRERSSFLESLGFTVLRFWNDEILTQTESVLTEILRILQALERPSEKDERI